MTRWKKWKLLGLTLVASGLVGCKQQLFERECDLNHYRNQALKLGAKPNIDTDIGATVEPAVHNPPVPQTIDSPDRPVRHLTLPEALAIALEQGTVGFQNLGSGRGSLDNFGQANETILTTRNGTTSDSIRVLALDPAISGTDIESALSKFDARFLMSQSWSKQDNATPNLFQSFQNGDQYNLNTGVYKPLPTGGVMGITLGVDYLRSENPGIFLPFNPTYRTRAQLQFEQPLLKDYGVEINQLTTAHPGTSQIARFRPSGGRTEGILITRVRFEQAKAEFERNINHMLLNVEAAYWNLYYAYGQHFARDQALVEAYELWRNIKNRVAGGLQEPHDEQRALAQLEAFRVQRYQALGSVIESERQLRLLLGMNDDGTRLVPIDTPTLAPYEPDWSSAVNEALRQRPELIMARQDLKVRQFDILVQKNQLKPDLRFFANYDLNGVGDQLDGGLFNPDGSFSNSLGVLALNKFNTWQFGFLLDVPIGYRDAHSAVRQSRLNLLRSYAALRDNERKVVQQVRIQYSRLTEFQRIMQAQHAQLTAAQKQYDLLKSRRDLQTLTSTLEQLLSAQRTVSDARTASYRAIADYNITMAGFQLVKGTIMQYDNVMIGEGALPECAQIRATEHFRERTKALVMRERTGEETGLPDTINIERDPLTGLMPTQMEAPPSVLQMMQNAPRPGGSAAPAGGPAVPATSAAPGLLPGFGAPNGAMPSAGIPQRPAGYQEPVSAGTIPR